MGYSKFLRFFSCFTKPPACSFSIVSNILPFTSRFTIFPLLRFDILLGRREMGISHPFNLRSIKSPCCCISVILCPSAMLSFLPPLSLVWFTQLLWIPFSPHYTPALIAHFSIIDGLYVSLLCLVLSNYQFSNHSFHYFPRSIKIEINRSYYSSIGWLHSAYSLSISHSYRGNPIFCFWRMANSSQRLVWICPYRPGSPFISTFNLPTSFIRW